ncbi:TonB-dependent receptor plug domain-containing protein [Roseibaca sp. Y0-43]|uniref:TonB-dependent receptor plug domain-containing protein n=1 Tax=Roseibaca sp. Y0-43 TaxID=2816854 RepID=UPI001D0C0394|nr:TonB-dependent receptor [Roseibaca sp. Y0-43]MCC1480233.1 TonB-dependent receptor [Roseibaca sp. Y0-43]
MTTRHFLGTVAALGLMAGGADAQEIINLEEVTFSANLTETELSRSGASVTVLTAEDIAQSGATTMVDLLRRQPGLSLTQNGGMGSPATLRLRGTEGRYTAIFVDGIRIDDPSGVQTQTDIAQVALSNIGRIEILRGSQSALYGGSSVGGVVNITTLRAEEDGLSQTFNAEAGSNATALVSYGLAYRQGRLELSFGLSHQRTDGETGFEGTPTGVIYAPNAEADGYEQTKLNFAARYQVTDMLALGVSGFVQRSNTEYDTFDTLGFASLDPNADAEADWRQWGVRAFAEFDLGMGTQEIGVSRYNVERRYIERVTFPSDNTYIGERTRIDWKGVSELSPGYTLAYGADWEREDYDQSGTFGGFRSDTTISGVYAQILARPTDALDVTAAIRYDDHSRFGGFLTGRVSFAYQASDALTLRAQIARGFRAPSNFELFSAFGDPTLGAETSVSGEIGADYRLANGGLLSATVFEVRIDGKIDYDFVTSRYAQIGASRNRGVELFAEVPLTERLGLTAAYTYTDAKVTKGPTAGTRLARVPRHHLSVGADLEITDRLRGSVGVLHVADRTAGLQDYTTADMGLRFDLTDTAELSLRVTNMFDKDYQEVTGYNAPGRAFYLGLAARF